MSGGKSQPAPKRPSAGLTVTRWHPFACSSNAIATSRKSEADLEQLPGPDRLAAVDPFDRVQLAEVVRVFRRARSLSEAGRILFSASRSRRAAPNDADRLRK